MLEYLEARFRQHDLDVGIRRAARRVALLESRRCPTEPWGAWLRCGSWKEFASAVRSAPVRPIVKRVPDRSPGGPVVVEMKGGLGNQMFEFAAAFAYARRAGVDVRVVTRWYGQSQARRQLLLSKLAVRVREASSFEIARARAAMLEDVDTVPRSRLFDMASYRLLSGHWESPAVFAGYESEIRRMYRPRDPSVLERARAAVSAVRRSGGTVVALHVRRGDRVPGHREAGALPASYYQEAVSRFPEGSTLLLFSDTPADVAWCRANLAFEGRYDVQYGASEDPIEDLFTIAACDHVVGSLSTFTWWGAWLNESPGKVVVVPETIAGYGPVVTGTERRLEYPPEWTVLPLPRLPRVFRAGKRSEASAAG
jgi:hypothetical protein